MEEEEESTAAAALQKRNTDCVYFLASPLTCKKGIECEYRHSEIARLNPVDCWYWLAGSCLNPSCAFRHPPLDGRTDTPSESASADHQSAVAVNKTNVPCYYYYNGFCNKGERCSFMHRPAENTYTWKSSKQVSGVVDGPPLEKKMFTGTDSGPASAEFWSGRTDLKSKAESKVIPQQESHQSISNIAAEESVCPQISESPSDEFATFRSNSPSQTEGLFQGKSIKSTDRGLDDELDNHIEQEEWLESSPGFDVLVNDKSEDLDYEDEALYSLHHNVENRECNGHGLTYDYGDDIEYDPAYPDITLSFKQGMPDWYDHVEEDACKITREAPFRAREGVLDCTLPRKRKSLQSESAGMDLRDYLKKRRMAESQYAEYLSGRPHSSCLIGKITEKASNGGRGHLRGRLASKVEISVDSRVEAENCSSSRYQHGRTTRPRINRIWQQAKERKQGKQCILSEVSGKTASRKRLLAEESTVFMGPKTLAQIKEEKEKALGGRDFSERRGPSSGDA